MALDLTAEQKELGKGNANAAAGELTRRGFMKSMAIAGAGLAPVAAASYFGYEAWKGKPVKAALIGTGDEGGVLVGEHNPDYLRFVAVCDVRPSNLRRVIEGEPRGLRKGFKKVYGHAVANEIKQFDDWPALKQELRANKDIEAIAQKVIADVKKATGGEIRS